MATITDISTALKPLAAVCKGELTDEAVRGVYLPILRNVPPESLARAVVKFLATEEKPWLPMPAVLLRLAREADRESVGVDLPTPEEAAANTFAVAMKVYHPDLPSTRNKALLQLDPISVRVVSLLGGFSRFANCTPENRVFIERDFIREWKQIAERTTGERLLEMQEEQQRIGTPAVPLVETVAASMDSRRIESVEVIEV